MSQNVFMLQEFTMVIISLGFVIAGIRIRDLKRRVERLETMLMQRSSETKNP